MSMRRGGMIVLAAMLGASACQPASAQPVERPADCQEVHVVGDIFIGHNCGDIASVVTAGRIVIKRPWSRVNQASRAERLRLRGGAPRADRGPASSVSGTFTSAPTAESPLAVPTASAPEEATGTGSRRARDGGSGTDIDCGDFSTQEEAQRYFDRQGFSPGNDPYSLDANNDGVACEDLPSRKG